MSCESGNEERTATLEDKLVASFSSSTEENRESVAAIVAASKEKNYAKAMNDLAILASTQINTPEQKQAIKFLMTQLRFSMEDQDAAN
ncbi:MAG: hypothetical protein HOH19_02585 [Kordiimonadaceae bacterium]|nr:hypothetical protein [Kordiimonadaceae bacterium]